MSNHQNTNPKGGGLPPGKKSKTSKRIDNARKQVAKFVAMIVRDGIEDFHCKYLTDEQMHELNTLVRDAIYTALYVMEHRNYPRFKDFIEGAWQAIPSYWEDPKLWPRMADPHKHIEEAASSLLDSFGKARLQKKNAGEDKFRR